MFISDDELKRRSSVKRVELTLEADPEDLSATRSTHKQGIRHTMTEGQRTMVGILAQFDTDKNVAANFGLSKDHVGDRLKFGRHRGDRSKAESIVDNEVKETSNDIRSTIEDRALEVAAEALAGIDVDDVEKPLQKAVLAEKMTTIAGRIKGDNSNKLHDQTIIFYSPKTREQEDYEVIDV